MKLFIKITEVINQICKYVITYLLIIVATVLFWQVVARFVFDTGTSWTDETARFATIWLVLLGVTVALRENNLMKVDVIDTFFPKVKKVLYYLELLVILLYSVFLLYVGWGTVDLVSAQRSPNMGISMSIVYAAVPVMSIVMILHLIFLLTKKRRIGGYLMLAYLVLGLVFMSLGIPVAIVIGLVSIIYIVINDIPINIITQQIISGIDVTALLAIPLFILAGDIMGKGGLAERMIRFASSLIGRVNGGLGIITIIGCMFFAAISGSGVATAAALGSLMIPAMVEKGYDRGLASSIVATSS